MAHRCTFVLASALVFLAGCSQDSGDSSDQTQSPGAPEAAQEAGQAPLGAPPTSQAIPPIRVTPSSLDWGLIHPGQAVEGSVLLQNISDQPQKIVTIQPSCKCTTTEDLNGVVIPPKGSVELVATLDPQSNTGTRRTVIRVLFEGFSSVLSINAKADVSRAVQVSPTYINAVDGSDGAPPENLSGSLEVKSVDGSPFSILSLHGLPPDINGWSDGDGPASSYQVNYSLADHTLPDGRFPRFLVIETDRADAPLIEVMVRHKLSRPELNRNFKLTDYKMNLGSVPRGGQVERVISVHEATTAGDLVQITNELGLVFDILEQQVDEVSDDLSADIRITVPEGAPLGFHYFPIQFYSSNQSQISIPAFIRVTADG